MTDESETDRSVEAPGTGGALRLEVDVRVGADATSSTVAAPTSDDVAQALGSLDQHRHTEVTIIDDAGAYIMVGGGRGRYHVYLGDFDHDDRIVLVDPDAPDGHEEVLVVDGRRATYAAGDVVDLDAASAAVRGFLRNRRPDPNLSWRTG